MNLSRPITLLKVFLIIHPSILYINKAILNYKGPAGKVLILIINYEKGNWSTVKKITESLKLNENKLFKYYINSLEEINKTVNIMKSS